MTAFMGPRLAAPVGSTGNNTHLGLAASAPATLVAFVLVVELGGATPAISWKVQGALNPDSVADASANWFDVALVPSNSDTVAAIPIVVSSATTGTISAAFLSLADVARFARRFRVVTSSNTNVTYRVELFERILQ